MFDTIINWLSDIFDSIFGLPAKIIEGIKEVFIPDGEELKESFETTMLNIQDIIGLNLDSVKTHFDTISSQPVADINGYYNISGVGTMKLKFFDTEFLRTGIDYFRPLLRGFLVLMLIFYNFNQVLKFFKQDTLIKGEIAKSVGGDSK